MSKKMLVVSAHGADWCTRAGGTILKYVNAGWEVTVYALTFGAVSYTHLDVYKRQAT